MASCPLQVAVRIRPHQPHDGKNGRASVQAADAATIETTDGTDTKTFVYDRVFGPEASQQEVYSHCALNLVDSVIEGTNACIFAFGSTGAGKTHSMLGPEGGRRQATQDGILPRAAAELFRRIARVEAEAKAAIGAKGFSAYEVRVSFLEVYCENAFDLLSGPVSASRDPSSSCQLRETTDGRVYADGAKEERIKSCEQLLDVVAAGARARATAATGVHAHSSRSHALLVVSVEHRWREVGETDPSKFKSQVARLTLVDLAGAESMERAHGGSVDAAGVGTNMGLLVLGRVIRALAEGSERVPYRDSTLTRLMQSSLGGKAKTQMLACVSPAAHEGDVTLSTLKYAASARRVLLKPEAAAIATEFESDPMLADVEDDDAALNRRCIWIETADFGDVFARCLGDPKDPLILYVHGSGPHNSSNFWNKLVMDVAVQASAGAGDVPKSYFQVAIDCPGYGRSPGDRQSIRSYPGALISNLVRALGRKTVACLVGSSQGACGTLNCALECPKLMHTIAVCHPVGHAPTRYVAINQPTLLIFDTEDAGHPVSVGRQMRRHLPNPRYFEFTRSADGDWEVHHMAEEMLGMMHESYASWRSKRQGGRRDKELPDLTRVAGGFNGWNDRHVDEIDPWGGYDASSELLSQCRDAEASAVEQLHTLEQLVEARQASPRLILQYGNKSAGSGGKRSYTTFFKVVSAEGVADKGSVAKVDFNINPGYSKPTASLKESNDKTLGFTFEYAMARAYPCHMTIHFKSELGLPKLVIEHYVQDEPKTTRRILLQLPQVRLPPSGAPRITEKETVFDADPPQNAWLCYQAGRSVLTTEPREFMATLLGAPAPDAAPARSISRKSSKASTGSRKSKG
ncbi:unnamed protein product [Effrenium voratum]|nr:unnamed protein product [Effrenium voratum]